jgi:hypothetical protein
VSASRITELKARIDKRGQGFSDDAELIFLLEAEIARKDAALREARTVLVGIASVSMQSRHDGEKLRELAEWRLESKRVLKGLSCPQ